MTNGSRSTDRSRSIDETDCFVRLRKHAELVLQLRGVEATEDMFGLVFKAGTTSGSASRDAGGGARLGACKVCGPPRGVGAGDSRLSGFNSAKVSSYI